MLFRSLLTARWAEDLTRKTEGVDDKTKKRALFYLEQMLAAFSPSNFAFTNPEVVRATLATNAANLVQGMPPSPRSPAQMRCGRSSSPGQARPFRQATISRR